MLINNTITFENRKNIILYSPDFVLRWRKIYGNGSLIDSENNNLGQMLSGTKATHFVNFQTLKSLLLLTEHVLLFDQWSGALGLDKVICSSTFCPILSACPKKGKERIQGGLYDWWNDTRILFEISAPHRQVTVFKYRVKIFNFFRPPSFIW